MSTKIKKTALNYDRTTLEHSLYNDDDQEEVHLKS